MNTPGEPPLFTPLGVYTPKRGPSVYFLRIRGLTRGFRSSDMSTSGFLFEILPDADHWRIAFPGAKRTGIDAVGASAHIMALCHAIGPYVPEESALAS